METADQAQPEFRRERKARAHMVANPAKYATKVPVVPGNDARCMKLK
jgi:N-acetyl-gamma-glutamylphosphate reductase